MAIDRFLGKIKKTDPKKFWNRLSSFSLNRFFGNLSHEVGIDLGTANTLVYVRGKGIVIREPSSVARKKKTKELLAIGSAAKKMEGRTPKTIESVRPLKDGVIADFDATVAMLDYYIKKARAAEDLGLLMPAPNWIISQMGGMGGMGGMKHE